MNRFNWILALKPGDTVCTCTHEHKVIERIEDQTEVKGTIALIPWVVGMVNMKVAYEIQQNLKRVHGEDIEDRVVYFADGTFCHALACLDPVGPGCLERHQGAHGT